MPIPLWLQEPMIRNVQVDSEDRIKLHREILLAKPMIRDVFFEFYRLVKELDIKYFGETEGKKLEIGSGSSLIKQIIPDIIQSDVVAYPEHNIVADAQNLPFGENQLRAIYGIHTFHHIPNPYMFLNELETKCAPGGGTILIDPYHGPVASVVFKVLFSNEDFDKHGDAILEQSGPMTDANQALTYIVFVRELKKMLVEHPDLEIVYSRPLTNYIRYLVSGGVNFRQMLPNWSAPALKIIEFVLSPLSHILALHHVIVIRRKR